MWDESVSGGIFIEHAVHFFDLFEGWFGEGEVISSQKVRRAGFEKEYWPEVQATVKYKHGWANFYHGFHQPNRMDRQEMKLIFELGDITLHEWIPTTMMISGLVSDHKYDVISNLFPDDQIVVLESYTGDQKHFKSLFKDRIADHKMLLEVGKNTRKLNLYKKLLQDMMADQITWLNNRDHQRVITETNALNSIIMAEAANRMAIKI